MKSVSRARPSATPWTAAFQAPLSMGFSRQEYWSGVPLPSPSNASKHTRIYIHTHTYLVASVVSDSVWPHGLYIAHQAPLSMGFSRWEYWSGLPCPPSGHLPDPGIKSRYPALHVASSSLSQWGSLYIYIYVCVCVCVCVCVSVCILIIYIYKTGDLLFRKSYILFRKI